MTDEAKALVEREGMQVLLPPASIDGDYLMGWLEGQSYLIANYGTDEAFDQAIAVANKVHKLQNLIVIQAREIERLNASLCETMAKDERLREALGWYEKQANDCRKITREGDDARYALDRDGGERARAALAGDSHAD